MTTVLEKETEVQIPDWHDDEEFLKAKEKVDELLQKRADAEQALSEAEGERNLKYTSFENAEKEFLLGRGKQQDHDHAKFEFEAAETKVRAAQMRIRDLNEQLSKANEALLQKKRIVKLRCGEQMRSLEQQSIQRIYEHLAAAQEEISKVAFPLLVKAQTLFPALAPVDRKAHHPVEQEAQMCLSGLLPHGLMLQLPKSIELIRSRLKDAR